MTTNWHDLIQRYISGTITEAETEALEQQLKTDPALRDWYLDALNLDSALEATAESAQTALSLPVPLSQRALTPVGATSTRWQAPLAWAAGFVAVASIGALMFVSLTPASAATIVREALKAHSALLDRCYRVEVRGERDGDAPPRQESLLWTRGDAFWTEIRGPEQTAPWGRDSSGSVWFALSPKIGARLTAAEVPEELETVCELRSVRLETLLREILADYELRREPATPETDLIHAEAKVGAAHAKYSSVLLEVDAGTHVLRRVTLHRAYAGRAVAVVSFTFIHSAMQSDVSYSLEGHLDPDGVVLDRRSGRGRRAQVIAEFLRLMRVRGTSERAPLQP
jgi:hypothetical protein